MVSGEKLQQEPAGSSGTGFHTTHWSVVLAAARNETDCANSAMERLCRAYWYPLYAHVRRRGHDHHAAQDLTQEFFARLLDKQWLASVTPERGRFRTFLLTAMDNMLANDWRDRRALKRGGGKCLLSLEEIQTGSHRFAAEPVDGSTANQRFDRAWAEAVLDHALSILRAEFAARGKSVQFNDWKVFLTREASKADCEASGRRLGISAGAVAVAVHRMRERYGELLRSTVADTLADPSDVDEELGHLFGLLNE